MPLVINYEWVSNQPSDDTATEGADTFEMRYGRTTSVCVRLEVKPTDGGWGTSNDGG